ncbi:MAG: hypothetical protein ACC707_08885 [Thiohalomonadales bacterium]
MAKQKLKLGEKVMLSTFGIFFLLAAMGYVILEIYRINSDKPLFTQTTHFIFSDEGKIGSKIYREANCNSCHRALRSGTSMGLSLDGIGSKRTVVWLETFLNSPKQVYSAKMIDHDSGQEADRDVVDLTARQKHLIAVFLSELKADAGSSVAKVPPNGRSEFIDSMIGAWAPKEWRGKYKDIRVRLAEEEAARNALNPDATTVQGASAEKTETPSQGVE